MVKFEDFAFSQDEILLVFSLQYHGVLAESDQEQAGIWDRMMKNQESADAALEIRRQAKHAWIKKWCEVTGKSLGGDVFDKEEIERRFAAFAKGNSIGKVHALVFEVAAFTPYFQFPKDNDNDKKDETTTDGLSFDEDLYLKGIKPFLQQADIPDALPKAMRSFFYKSVGVFQRATGISLKGMMLWVSVAALIALIAAPYLAGVIGAAMGLGGAAATSAGLALLGGGSIAAGGLGMAGGYFAVMAGGMLLGYLGATAEDKAKIRGISTEELMITCAKIYGLLLAKNKQGLLDEGELFRSRRSLAQAVRHLEYDIGKELDATLIAPVPKQGVDTKQEKKRKKDAKKAAAEMRKKSSILREFREKLREM